MLNPEDQASIVNALKRGLCVPVVGAGLSMAVGAPSGNAYIEELLSGLPDDVKENARKSIDPMRSWDTADYLFHLRKQNRLDPVQVDVMNPSSVHIALARLNCPLYVTTNYDNAMEKALIQVGRDPEVMCHDQLSNVNLFEEARRPLVVKLCSTSSNPNPGAITRRDFAKLLYQDRTPQELLVTLMRTRLLLFLGSSMLDPIITTSLDRCFADGIGRPKHFVCLPENTPESVFHTMVNLGLRDIRLPSTEITAGINRLLEQFPLALQTSGRVLVIESPLPTRAAKILETFTRLNHKGRRIPALTFVTDSQHRADEIEVICRQHPQLHVQIEKVPDLHNGKSTARQLMSRNADAIGILALSEYSVTPASLLVSEWQGQGGQNPLPYHSATAAARSRDKSVFRQFLREKFADDTTIGVPAFGIIECSGDSAIVLYEKIRAVFVKMPSITEVVVKPIDSAGSVGVRPVKLDEASRSASVKILDELLSILRAMPADAETERNTTTRVLVEQRIFGEEFSIESVRVAGKSQTLVIHWKIDIDSDSLRFFERTFVTLPLSRPEFARLDQANCRILDKMGVGDGVFHSEFRLCVRTGLVFPLEIALRQGGGMVVSSVMASTGVDLFEVAVMSALGWGGLPKIDSRRAVATGLVFANKPGILPPLGIRQNENRRFIKRNDSLTLKEWLSAHIRTIDRDKAASTLKTALKRTSEIPLVSEVMAEFGNLEASGLRANVDEVRLMMEPGDFVDQEEATYVAGVLIKSDDELGDNPHSVVEVLAAMNECLRSIDCEPLESLVATRWQIHPTHATHKAEWFTDSQKNQRGLFRSDDDSWVFALAVGKAITDIGKLASDVKLIDLGCGTISPIVGWLTEGQKKNLCITLASMQTWTNWEKREQTSDDLKSIMHPSFTET
jgi:hypothetical protein